MDNMELIYDNNNNNLRDEYLLSSIRDSIHSPYGIKRKLLNDYNKICGYPVISESILMEIEHIWFAKNYMVFMTPTGIEFHGNIEAIPDKFDIIKVGYSYDNIIIQVSTGFIVCGVSYRQIMHIESKLRDLENISYIEGILVSVDFFVVIFSDRTIKVLSLFDEFTNYDIPQNLYVNCLAIGFSHIAFMSIDEELLIFGRNSENQCTIPIDIVQSNIESVECGPYDTRLQMLDGTCRVLGLYSNSEMVYGETKFRFPYRCLIK